MKYKRILLKLSGESLQGPQKYGISTEVLDSYARQIKEALQTGVQIGIVIGGGNIFRGLQGARKGFDRVKGDQMGMLATIINSLALQSALEDNDVKAKVLTSIRMEPIGEYYSKAKALEYLEAGKLADLLNAYKVEDGDSYFIPSKTIHAIGKGLLIAEIQQTSDITYRVFDWNRVDPKTGKGRELHTELALDAIDYKARSDYKTVAAPQRNAPVTLEKCPYFQTNSLVVDGTAVRDYAPLDSFVIYICLDGELTLTCESGSESLKKGETVLIPAEMNEVTLSGRGKVLEVYIPEEGK